jgi:hypothetical protein
VIPQGNGRYIVQSFKNREESYSVDLNENTCSCPHSIRRNADDCKHRQVARQRAYEEARRKAAKVALDDLRNLLLFNYEDSNRPEICEALDYAIWEREQAARTFSEMVSL